LKRNHMMRKRCAALAAGAALLGFAFQPSLAQAAATVRRAELAVKAAFLVKFPAYVAWPPAARPRAGAPLQICILGGDPFGRLIDDAARGQQVDGHPLQVRRLKRPADAGGCHVVFVQGNAPSLLQGLQGKPMLTVTDARDGGSRGGMIQFVVHEGRVRFNIDQIQAAKSGVGISSRLLGLALTVRPRR
jgi:YfiR/HmsC-like